MKNLLDPQLVSTATRVMLNVPRVIIVTHEHPDGDAIGSSLALAYALTNLGRSVSLVCRNPVPETFQFLGLVNLFQQELELRRDDLVLTLDCGDIARTGFCEQIKSIGGPQGRVINIDHHQKNDLHKIATLNLVAYEASSTAELIYEIIKDLNIRIDKQIATDLMTGIYTDTGGFRHSNTSPRVLAISSELMLAGARLRQITRSIANFRTVPSLRVWGIALERIRYHIPLGIVASVVTRMDLTRCAALTEDIAGAVNLLNHVPEARVAILCTETVDGFIKASLRTESSQVDVAKLANLFGGGGLKRAAGFTIRGTIQVENDGWRISSDTNFPDFFPMNTINTSSKTLVQQV